MSRFLLDVNVLIALIDPAHVKHDQAHDWLSSPRLDSWATCPLTQNGVLRIVGSVRYGNTPGTPAAVVDAMRSLLALPGHEFWPDDITLLDPQRIHLARLLNSSQITDSYLLALASAHNAKLATFDTRLVTAAVVNGRRALHLIQ